MKNIFFFSFLFISIYSQNNTQINKDILTEKDNKTKNDSIILKNNITIQNSNSTNETSKLEKFNLTDTFINFFKDLIRSENDNNDTIKKNQNNTKDTNAKKSIDKTKDVKIDTKKKERERINEIEERENFDKYMDNTKFNEYMQIDLERGEKEIFYLDLDKFTKVKMAMILSDADEKFTLKFYGPNAKGKVALIQEYKKKNFLSFEYETIRKGEYTIEIKNKGSKMNELTFYISEEDNNKKKDILDTEKIDKISKLLQDIDDNVSQMRTKKKVEIKKINSHNNKIDSHNKSIIIYSMIEIFTMIIIFIAQTYYISSFVKKI